ncbi:MAG TPA: PhzF family phenazine biosynthesis protein [Pyrinomonadaceae bacterium]|nr:PhzF family phenazine biosynthesis protein [Pyrinomonadaceae bacterium]
MARHRFIQLDVFTKNAFSGNPLAVFPEAEGIEESAMQKIAREMNLSETVFVLPPEDERALRRLRIFTPTSELPMAGHPVVGTWNLLAHEGVVPPPEGGEGLVRVHQEIGIGVLPVDIEFQNGEPGRVVMTQGEYKRLGSVEGAHERAEIERAIGLAPEDFDESLPIEVVSTGISFLLVPVNSLMALSRCRINSTLLAAVYKAHGATGCCVFTRETREGAESAAHMRMFAPGDNIPEDPATGSCAGALSSYLVYHGALSVQPSEGVFRFRIEQGDFIERPSRIDAEIRGERGRVEEVRVGGTSVIVAEGHLIF